MSIADKLKTVAQKMEDVYRTGLFKYAPKLTASGRMILLENSAPEPFVNMKPYGHSWQNTTEGNQLFDVESFKNPNNWNHAVYDYQALNLQVGTYTLSFGENKIHNENQTAIDNDVAFYIGTNAGTYEYNEIIGNSSSDVASKKDSYTFTVNHGEIWYINVYFKGQALTEEALSTIFDELLIDTMLNVGTEALPYEPFTHGATPNPYYPQPIESTKEIKILGENLFDGKALVDSGCFTENDGVYTSVELRDQVIWRNTENITEQMVLSFKYKQHTNAMGYMFVIVYTDGARDRAYTNKVYGEWDSVVLVTNEEKVVSHMELYYSAGDTSTSFNDIWLEIGTEVHGNAQTLILPNLHGIGDVRDYVDYDRKKLVRRYAEINPSTLDWYAIDTSRYYCDIPNIKERSVTENNGHSLFTHGEYKNAIWSDTSKTGYVINNTNLHVRDASVSTLEELLAKIQDSVLLYELANPIETDLTDEQIYAFKILRANSPTTTIIGQGQVDVTCIVDNRQ